MAVRSNVVLQGMVGMVLFPLSKHDAIDLRIGAFANQRDMLIYLCQATANCGNGPL